MSAIHIWKIDWRKLTVDQVAFLISVLTPEDHARADRYKQPDDRQRFICGRAMLRVLSAQALGVFRSELTLLHHPKGKPYWANEHQSLGVNLSHAGDWIYIALAPRNGSASCATSGSIPNAGIEIGIDVQDHRTNIDMSSIASIAMHPEEDAFLESLSAAEQKDVSFFQLWTLREAALKATGDGFFSAPDVLNALPLPPKMVWTERRYGEHTSLSLMCLPGDHATSAAVAVVTSDTTATPPRLVPDQPVIFSRADLILK